MSYQDGVQNLLRPNILSKFMHVCPSCGLRSFFSQLSLDLHKTICFQILRQEWISYSQVLLHLCQSYRDPLFW